MRRAIWAFCSTSRNVVPRSSWILRMMSKISRTSSGHAAEAQMQVFQSEKCHSLVTPGVPGGSGETVTASRASADFYGPGVGREKMVTVAELRGALQKYVAFPVKR